MIECYEQRLVIAREIGDRRGEANAIYCTALALDSLGRTFPQASGTTAQLIIVAPAGESVREAGVRDAIEASADRFAALIQAYLDDAAADGSIAPLDTRVATLAWLGAVNEIVAQWLHGTVTDLRATIAPLTRILLQSIGADPRPR